MLNEAGDTRPGVGLGPDGLPDIVWLPVQNGTETINGQDFQFDAFYIAKYPITYQQFNAFIDDPNGYTHSGWWVELALQHDQPGTQNHPFDNHPRDNVSWFDSVAFCRWLTARLAKSSSEIGRLIREQDWQVRLPSEWEWQHAATGGDPAYRYPWGAVWEESYTQPIKDGLGLTTAVGLYPQGRSPVGALDMCSNVWEWCLNHYNDPADTGYSGPERRALRGGMWELGEDEGTTIFEREFELGPYARTSHKGFRISCCPPHQSI